MNTVKDAVLQRLRKKPLIFLLAVLVLIVLILLLRGCGNKETDDAAADAVLGNSHTIVKISALGNIQMDDALLASALQSDGSYNFSESLTAITADFASSDLTVANLELNFCEPPYNFAPFRAPKTFAQTLSLSGIDVVQTVNSATAQNGMTGITSTIEALNAAGIDHVGTYESESALTQSGGVLIKNVNGLRIAFVAFSKGLGGLQLPEGKEYAADLLYEDYATDYSVLNEKEISQRLAAANNANPDIIVALLHWGNEFDASVSPKQEAIVQLLMDNNVGVILGTHPNNVGKIEKIEREEKDGTVKTCWVAYSLGNFFTSSQKGYANESVIVHFEIKKNGVTGEVTVENFSYTPIFINETTAEGKTLYQILPVRKAIKSSLFKDQKQELTDCLARLRQYTESDYDNGK